MKLADEYKLKATPIIKKVIVDTINKPDLEIQKALLKAFPWHQSNLVAWKIWLPLCTELRQYYFKHKTFKNVRTQPEEEL